MSVKYIFWLLYSSLIATVLYAQDYAPTQEEQQAKLEAVRNQIRDLTVKLKDATNAEEALAKELEIYERQEQDIHRQLQHARNAIISSQQQLAELAATEAIYQTTLNMRRQQLFKQIQLAYQIHQYDYLQILLNQPNLPLFWRLLSYADYQNQSRAIQIQKITADLAALSELTQQINMETQELNALQRQQDEQIIALKTQRDKRAAALLSLQNTIGSQDQQLAKLRKNESALEQLLQELPSNGATAPPEIANFNSLRGQLQWPVSGPIRADFGSPRKGSALTWKGVIIDAQAGQPIHAISSGKVVFADWFKNLGLLLIIEHGNGFMSLYAHNQSLKKKVGDWVSSNEIIATIGDSGGQRRAGLYFEIRQYATPLNPHQWCQR